MLTRDALLWRGDVIGLHTPVCRTTNYTAPQTAQAALWRFMHKGTRFWIRRKLESKTRVANSQHKCILLIVLGSCSLISNKVRACGRRDQLFLGLDQLIPHLHFAAFRRALQTIHGF